MTEELKSKFVGRFVGPDKIADIEVTEVTTPSGAAIFKLTYESGYSALLPEKGLMAVITDEPADYNHMFEARNAVMIPEVIDIFLEYDMPTEQFVAVLGRIGDQLRNRIYRAESFLLHGDDRRYIPGSAPENEMTLSMAQRIIASIPEKTKDTDA
jgi:hypothetical protein